MKQWLETREVFDRLAALGRAGMRAALATVVRVRGSAYRHEGAKLLVAEDGSTTGNVSGGCLEQDVREVALQVLRSGRAELRTYCSGTDEIEAWDLGLGCEGQIDVFVEPAAERPRERAWLDGRIPFAVCTIVVGPNVGRRMLVTHDAVEGSLGQGGLDLPVAAKARELLRAERSAIEPAADRSVFIESLVPPPQLVLFGAGDDARPLAQFGAAVGFRVVVVDYRPAYLAPDRFPVAVLRVETEPQRLSERLTLDESCYAVVMTHNFAHDRAILRGLLRTPVPYIGMLGPRQRTEHMLRDLSEAASELGRIYGPVGLDIGTDGAEQVALSVLAEILAVRSGRQPRSLRERAAPIHAYSE